MLFRNQDVRLLREECKFKNTLFVDPEFPPKCSSLSHDKNFTAKYNIVWKRPPELCTNPCLLLDGNNAASPRQGRLGNCWLVAACSCLASHQNVFHKVIPEMLLKWSDYWGIFELQFWRYGTWVRVVIDDLLPTCDGELLYCHSHHPNEFWCALLEKAYAKLLGNYESLEGGELADALVDFTGGFTEWFSVCLPETNLPTSVLIKLEVLTAPAANEPSSKCFEVQIDMAYQYLRECFLNQILIAVAIMADCADDQLKETPSGLVIGHAYAVTQIIEIPISDNCSGKGLELHSPIRLVQLMNPWGHNKWKGVFRTDLDDWKFSVSDILKQYGIETHEDGQFWMLFEDFIRNFNYVVLCHLPLAPRRFRFAVKPIMPWIDKESEPPVYTDLVDLIGDVLQPKSKMDQLNSRVTFPHNLLWTEQVCHSEWTSNFDGGCLNFTESFAKNPQFVVNIVHPFGSWVTICLIQKTVRSSNQCNSTTGLFHIGFSLFRVEGKHFVPRRSFHLSNLICSSVYRNSRSVWVRLGLNYGQYILVPTTFSPKCHTAFMLRLFGIAPLPVVQINGLRHAHYHDIESSTSNLTYTKRTLSTDLKNQPISYITKGSKLLVIYLKFAMVQPVSCAIAALFDSVRSKNLQPLLPTFYVRLISADQVSITSAAHMTRLIPNTTCGLIVLQESFIFSLYQSTNCHALNSIQIELWMKNSVFDQEHSRGTLNLKPRYRLKNFSTRIPLIASNSTTPLAALPKTQTLKTLQCSVIKSSRTFHLNHSRRSFDSNSSTANSKQKSLQELFGDSDTLLDADLNDSNLSDAENEDDVDTQVCRLINREKRRQEANERFLKQIFTNLTCCDNQAGFVNLRVEFMTA